MKSKVRAGRFVIRSGRHGMRSVMRVKPWQRSIGLLALMGVVGVFKAMTSDEFTLREGLEGTALALLIVVIVGGSALWIGRDDGQTPPPTELDDEHH